MKKAVCILLIVLVSSVLTFSAMAASEGPVITLQPQSPNYPNYSVAIYTVKADGTNLQATWYMEWLGETYTISDIGGAMQAWEPYAGEAYGPRKLDDNTFAFIFEGIEYDLDGAYIWCVIEDGHYEVTSQKNRISVGNENLPPEIVSIPSWLRVEQGDAAEIRCVAKSADDSELSFLWYETDTGKREDIRAVNRGTETADTLLCDTSEVGTRNYICMVESANGGMTYSSVVPVTVVEKQPEPTQPDATQPDATDPPTQPSEPEKTEPTTQPSAPQTADQPSDVEKPEQADNNGWIWVVVAAVAGVAVGALSVVLLKKKK